MSVTVEFFGVARERAGQSSIDVTAGSLGEALTEVATRCPQLAGACLQGNRLSPTFIANINGREFVKDPQTPLSDGDRLLILSADVGG